MPVMQSPPGAETTIDGRRYTYFAGTGYLGLQGHPDVIRAACEALRIVIQQPEILARLQANVVRLRTGLCALGLDVDDSPAAVIAIQLGNAEQMQRIQKMLAERGIWIAYVPSYSGVGSTGLLRLAVFATHTDQMIDYLLGELAGLL